MVPARTNSQPQRENETRRPFAGYLTTNVQLININQYLLIFLKEYLKVLGHYSIIPNILALLSTTSSHVSSRTQTRSRVTSNY